MNKVILITLFIIIAIAGWRDKVPLLQHAEIFPGGQATVSRLHQRSYINPAGNISPASQLEFWTGFSLFRDPWVIAPASTDDRDGLGPLFNTRSCISCHTAGGRGTMSEPGLSLPKSLVLRLGNSQPGNHTTDPYYGGQIQPRAINKLAGEAWLELSYQPINGRYEDGQSYQLQQPNYRLAMLSAGSLADNIRLSPRFAPNIFGMGLLDAISETDLLQQQDIDDIDQDGISAKYNQVPNVSNGKIEIGRFGLKAKQPNLQQQVAAAFRDDIGITNSLFPQESCNNRQIDCLNAVIKADNSEINDHLLQLVVTFSRFVGVPPSRKLDQKEVANGRSIFYQIGCQSCHTPSYTTAKSYPIKPLANITIWPYTDLALHDMGPGLADGVNEYEATGSEWRTPPLWGIGLQQKILGQQRFLHDGRARDISEAILWHGGEAQTTKQKFRRLNQQQRQQLIRFLKAI